MLTPDGTVISASAAPHGGEREREKDGREIRDTEKRGCLDCFSVVLRRDDVPGFF